MLSAAEGFAGYDGLFHGAGDQVWRQALASGVVAVYSFVVTFGILKVLDLTMGIRVSEEEEIAGLDVSQHGERAYIFAAAVRCSAARRRSRCTPTQAVTW